MRLLRTEAYRADLNGIVDYIVQDNPIAALEMWDKVENCSERLQDYPHSGRLGRLASTRELIVTGTPFLIVYSVDRDIHLLRILHGAQAWPPA